MLALLLGIGVAGILSPLLLPKADLMATPQAGCDLHRQACAADPAGWRTRIELAIAPHGRSRS